jgi:hypothetical protein
MINFSITGGTEDCQAKNRPFSAIKAENDGILGSNSGEILLIGWAKGSICSFFSAMRTWQGTIRSFWG